MNRTIVSCLPNKRSAIELRRHEISKHTNGYAPLFRLYEGHVLLIELSVQKSPTQELHPHIIITGDAFCY